MAPWCRAGQEVIDSFNCLHNNAFVARGSQVTQLHCGTPKLCLSAIYIVSSVGTSLSIFIKMKIYIHYRDPS